VAYTGNTLHAQQLVHCACHMSLIAICVGEMGNFLPVSSLFPHCSDCGLLNMMD
jgi:hypothetical protein